MSKLRNILFLFVIASLMDNAQALTNTAPASRSETIATKIKPCLFPKSKKRAPTWVCGGSVNGWPITALGSAEKSKAGAAFMQQMATADARKNLAEKMVGAKGKSKLHRDDEMNSRSERGGTVIHEETLLNTKIIKSIYGPKGRLYVLLGVEEDAQ